MRIYSVRGRSLPSFIPLHFILVQPPLTRKLNINEEKLPASSLVIRAFDGAKRRALGEISLEVEVGSVTFDTTFQILETAGSFNMLLGRPWIHQAGAIPSNVHQMVRFAHGGKLITIRGEHDVPICNVIEVSFGEPSTAQTVEIINKLRQVGGTTSPLDSGTVNAARYKLRYGYQVGQGLGARGQGRPHPIDIVPRGPKEKSGLGYPSVQELDYMSQNYPQQDQLLDDIEHLGVNAIEEAPDSSAADATLKG